MHLISSIESRDLTLFRTVILPEISRTFNWNKIWLFKDC